MKGLRMEISYYDLLGMIQEGNAPKKISVSLTYGTSRIYKAEYDADDFTMYFIDDRNEADEDYKLYLSECFLESSMFDKCITILDEEEKEDNFTGIKFFQDGECVMSILNEPQIPVEDEFEDIEELKLDGDFGGDFLINDEGNRCHISSHDKTIVNRINKVIKNQKKIIERLKDNENKRI